MVNDATRIGLANNVSSMKALCKLAYGETAKYNIVNYYRLCSIARAAGILASRKKSLHRGIKVKSPYSVKRHLVSCYGFKVRDEMLKIPLGNKRYFDIPLNKHTAQVLSAKGITIRSFTLTNSSVSISYSKEVEEMQCTRVVGIDRNLRNITAGDCYMATCYDISKAVEIVDNTRSIISSFKRNDAKVRKKIFSKYGKRRNNRIDQMLHRVSKHIVQQAKENQEAIVFEDIRRIRQLYQRGNGQGNSYRGMMNSWSFFEAERQIKYKAKWEGVPVIQLSKQDTRGTSQFCPQCGERLQEDRHHHRQLWCPKCKRWQDRDVVAAMNLSLKGLARFASSKGIAGEAMRGNVEKEPLILRVDAMKLSLIRREITLLGLTKPK